MGAIRPTGRVGAIRLTGRVGAIRSDGVGWGGGGLIQIRVPPKKKQAQTPARRSVAKPTWINV